MMKHLFFIIFGLTVIIAASAKDMQKIHVDAKNFVDENGKSQTGNDSTN